MPLVSSAAPPVGGLAEAREQGLGAALPGQALQPLTEYDGFPGVLDGTGTVAEGGVPAGDEVVDRAEVVDGAVADRLAGVRLAIRASASSTSSRVPASASTSTRRQCPASTE